MGTIITRKVRTSLLILIILQLFPVSDLHCQQSADNTITLENSDFRVVLSRERPAILEYQVKAKEWITLENQGSSGPGISFLQGALPVMRNRTVTTFEASLANNQVVYHTKITYENKPAVEFDLVYRLNGKSVTITFRNVVEFKNFYLLNVQLPWLLTIRSDESHAKMIIPADAGRMIDIEKASLKSYEYDIDWLNPILTGFAYNSEVLGMIDTKSIENHTIVSVSEGRDKRYGSFSMRMIHRLNEYNLHEFGTIIPVTDPKYLLKVQDSCSVTVTFTGDYDGDGEISWVDGAKLFREGVKAVPNPYYRDKSFIRIFLSRRGSKNENLTFDEVLERIKEFAAQTDSASYVVYLLGWQYSGHDTGYPSVDKVNEDLGGYDRLVNLINEAKKYNVNVTFYDNYDDSYPKNPGWDPDVICMDPNGNIMRGGAWDGEQSYLISSYKYAVKSGLERVRFTLDRYPVKEAYFIDVLAGGYKGGRKYDFNPKSPAAAIKNLEGKLMLVNEFNKRGIDVATEDFTGFFVGHVGTFGDICAFDNIYFYGEEQIPLIPFIYHGKTSFGLKTTSQSFYPRTFLYGQRAQKLANRRSPFRVSEYILDALPKQKLYGKTMDSYERYGDLERVTYEDGIVVEANIATGKYSVKMADGLVIAKDNTAFAPIEENVFLACSRDGGTLSYKIPDTWKNTEKIRVYSVNNDGSLKNIQYNLDDRLLKFITEPGAPYRVVFEY
jgi:Endo-alpha-N-acetylgalactosaminidase